MGIVESTLDHQQVDLLNSSVASSVLGNDPMPRTIRLVAQVVQLKETITNEDRTTATLESPTFDPSVQAIGHG